ncbi:MAG: glutamate--tRNA ligase [Phycisphaerae bacterium]|nr:glutamate--tRNA ligase [Phycisphaerae bacterium]
MSNIVRTRFAPSPTGYLHIGGARTALFNYLFARRAGGKFVIRIEDTDQTRNIAGAELKLLEDLRWLGLEWDEGPEVGGPHGPYFQSQRLDLYDACARQLLDSGLAYYAFDTREELEAMRQDAQKRGERGFRYSRPATFPSETQAQKARDEGRPVVVRFKMPERDWVINDLILGDVNVNATELSDFVIVKADGWPTYHFAVVVDDAAMQITHVMRGQEHLLNTVNHNALQEAFGYPKPACAHMPIIFTMKGTKMSKREKDKALRDAVKAAGFDDARISEIVGLDDREAAKAWRKGDAPLPSDGLLRLAHALNVALPEIDIHDFRASGYLPEVIVNFIALLGWSAGDDREKFTLDDLCQAFSIERVGKTSAKFDREKLLNFNTTAAAEASTERLVAGLRDYVTLNPESPLAALDDAMLAQLVDLNRGFRTFRDIETKAGALFVPDEQIQYDAGAVKKWLLKGDGEGTRGLADLRQELETLSDWSAATIEALIRACADKHELGLGKVAQPLRIAVTGMTVSPSIFETLAILGQARTLARIDRVLDQIKAGGTE